MARVRFNNLAQYGVIREVPDHSMPINAWTTGDNVTFRDGFVQKSKGYAPITSGDDGANPLLLRPQYILPYFDPTGGVLNWIYGGVDDSGKGKISVFNGTTNVDRTATAYPGAGYYGDTVKWNGAVVNGVAVINNQLTVPQVWGRTGPNLDAQFKDLTNWAASFSGLGTCKVIRGFKNFFVAIDVNDAGATGVTRNPYEIRHSGIVDPYTPPQWAPTTANRAGSKYIGEGGGILIDCLPMRGVNIVYSEREAWPMTYVGGNEVFAIGDKALLEYGMMASGCAVAFGAGQHFLVSVGDIVTHDGTNVVSIIDSRTRDDVFNEIDETYYERSFCISHFAEKEIWFCYPTKGHLYPNKVAKWNMATGAWSFMVLPIEVSSIRFGAVPASTSSAADWDSDSASWDSDSTVWNEANYNPVIRNLIMAEIGSTIALSALNRADNTNMFDGTLMQATLERTGLTVVGEGQNGPVSDPTADKFIREIWPQIGGGQVNIQIGTSNFVHGPYDWAPSQLFDPLTHTKLDFRPFDGKYWAIRFFTDQDVAWHIDGYEVDIVTAGGRGA